MADRCITRYAGPITLEGIRASTLTALRAAFAGSGDDPVPVVADLSLGAWRSHQVAAEFYAQLRPAIAYPAALATGAVPTSYGEFAGAGIDQETQGDRSIIAALDLATGLVNAVRTGPPRCFLVLAPRFNLPWESEDVALLSFLAEGLRGSSTRLVLVAAEGEDPPLPAGWVVSWQGAPEDRPAVGNQSLGGLVPGLLTPDIAGALDGAALSAAGGVLALGGGHLLVAPEYRRSPHTVPRLEYDRLAVAAQPFPWLEAYAQCYGNNLYVDSAFLSAEGQRRFVEGGYGISLRLVERAVTGAATPAAQVPFLVQLQGMRIALQRYRELAGMPDPAPAAWPPMRAILLKAKGWGLTMMNDAPRAAPYFEQAQQLLAENPSSREYLYLLNIAALNKMKLGDVAGAFANEQVIEATLARQPRRDWHLEYINSINLARLYRRMERLTEAEEYYERAFATTLGVRSENDTLYTNVSLARLHAECGRTDEAFLGWLRAGLHWASNSVPEALGERIVRAILSPQADRTGSLAEAISGALATLLRNAARAMNDPAVGAVSDLDCATLEAPAFVGSGWFASSRTPPVPDCAVGGPGWSILATGVAYPPPFAGPQHRQLRALLYALLQALAPGAPLAGAPTLVVDDRMGQELARTFAELLDTCLRFDVPKMVFDGEVTELGVDVRARLVREAHVQLGPAVAEVEFDGSTARVSFKRYRSPVVLDAADSAILALLPPGTSRTVAEVARGDGADGDTDRVLPTLRRLQHERILNLFLTETAHVFQRLVSSRF
jgi:tetratricopeptide (TPR) repeat protein